MITSQNRVMDYDPYLSEDDDYTVVVSIDGDEDPSRQANSGVLIVPGEEDDADEVVNHHVRAADDISLPGGTDSVPTEIDTISDILPNSSNAGDESWIAHQDDDSTNGIQPARRKKTIVLIALVAFVGLSSIMGFGYRLLKEKDLALEKERKIREEERIMLEKEQEMRRELQEKLRQLELAKSGIPPKEQQEDDCKAGDEDDGTVLFDNCYFRVTTNDCGNAITAMWRDFTNRFYETYHEFSKITSSEPRKATFDREYFEEASLAVAKTMTSAADAVNNVIQEVTTVADETFIRMVEATREVIDEATAATRPNKKK